VAAKRYARFTLAQSAHHHRHDGSFIDLLGCRRVYALSVSGILEQFNVMYATIFPRLIMTRNGTQIGSTSTNTLIVNTASHQFK
jgi:hypothetical protein